MNSLVGLGVFGTFGQPFGFQQTFYLGVDFKESLDLDENVIEVYPGQELYSVKRELVNGVYSIAFCIYSYVKELYSDRIGTFIGSCIVLQDGYAEAEYIYKLLRELHNDTLSNTQNVEDNTIRVQQAHGLVVREPEGFVAVRANVIPISKTPFYSTYVDPIKKILVRPDDADFSTIENKVIAFFDESLKYYTDADTLYFTFDDDVAGYAGKKGFVQLLFWADFMAYKSRSQQQTVVRTKKGIHRHAEVAETVDAVAPPPVAYHSVVEEILTHTRNGNGSHAVATASPDVPAYKDTDSFVDEDYRFPAAENDLPAETEIDGDDPNKPFDKWEEPAEPWTKKEIKYRVREYNRLFNYTNSLLEHINSGRGRRRKNKAVKAEKPVSQPLPEAMDTDGTDSNDRFDKPAMPKKSLRHTLFGSKRRRGVFLLVIAGIACLGAGVYNFFFNKTNQSIVSKNVVPETVKPSAPAPVPQPTVAPADTAQPPKRDSMADALAAKQKADEQRRKDSLESLQATTRSLRSTVNKAVGRSATLMANDKAQQQAQEPEQKKVLPEPYVPEPEPAAINKKGGKDKGTKPAAQPPAPAKPIVPTTIKRTTTEATKQPTPTSTVSKQPTVSAAASKKAVQTNHTAASKAEAAAPMPEPFVLKELRPQPNFEMSQKDIAAFSKSGVKGKTVEEIVKMIFDNVPTNVGNVYRSQELDYISLFLNTNRQSFQKSGNSYICTSDYVILHIPAYKSPRLPVVFPK